MKQSERQARVLSLLEDNVRTELQVVNGMIDLGLSDDGIEQLVDGVTSGLLYAFEVDWAPDWVKPGEVHTWVEEGAWFALCSSCLLDSPPLSSKDEAAAWARDHDAGH